MCSDAIFKKFDTIVEFTAFENFCSFDKKVKNKIKRVENHKIKVTIEVDLVCGGINSNKMFRGKTYVFYRKYKLHIFLFELYKNTCNKKQMFDTII